MFYVDGKSYRIDKCYKIYCNRLKHMHMWKINQTLNLTADTFNKNC